MSIYLDTLVERKSGYALVGHIPKATKETFRLKAEALLAPLQKHMKRSLSLDNGTEMSGFATSTLLDSRVRGNDEMRVWGSV